jgi:hypothetical protein
MPVRAARAEILNAISVETAPHFGIIAESSKVFRID